MIRIHFLMSWSMNFHRSSMFPADDMVSLWDSNVWFWRCSSFDIGVFAHFSQLFGDYGRAPTSTCMWSCILFLLNVCQRFRMVFFDLRLLFLYVRSVRDERIQAALQQEFLLNEFLHPTE